MKFLDLAFDLGLVVSSAFEMGTAEDTPIGTALQLQPYSQTPIRTLTETLTLTLTSTLDLTLILILSPNLTLAPNPYSHQVPRKSAPLRSRTCSADCRSPSTAP